MRPIDLPPRHCPMCLVGACHRCTGRMIVLMGPAEVAQDVPCEHVHRRGEAPAELPSLLDVDPDAGHDDEPTRRPIETVEIPGVSR